jgi:UDP-3-O-[3-hydroxymyristoyl] N-acetylglucosamine deacetylase
MGRANDGWQRTLADRIEIEGVGVHGGAAASLTIRPAPADAGISFIRTDLPHDRRKPIRARHRDTATTELATVIGDPSTAAVSTVEHLMAAFYGLGVDNATVEIDGPEVPILDGSSLPFVEAIEQAGMRRLAAPRRVIEILKPVRVENGAQFGELTPHDGFRVDVEIVFDHAAIGRQRVVVDMTSECFVEEIAGARTFGFIGDVERLWAAGYALGASLENTIVVDGEGVMNDDGLRWADEFVRHKALDAVGDLALAGLPIRGAYRSSRGGHKLNSNVLSALFADPSAFRIVVERPEPVPARVKVRAGGWAAASAAYGPSR